MTSTPTNAPVRPGRTLSRLVLPLALVTVVCAGCASDASDVLASGSGAATEEAVTSSPGASVSVPPSSAPTGTAVPSGDASPLPSASAPTAPAEAGGTTQGRAGSAAAAPEPAQGRTAAPGRPARPGSLDPVPTRPVPTLPAVALDRSAAFGTGVAARISRVDKVDVVGQGPGEISGRALAVHLELVNETQTEVPLQVIVSMNRGKDTEAVPSSQSPARPIEGVLAPGATASGVYVFVVPPEDHGNFRVRVSYAPGNPVLVFRAG